MAGAILTGTIIFGFGGWVRGLVLIAFFLSSTAWSHYKDRQKVGLAEKFAKSNRRDLGQTLANGGAAALLALAVWFAGGGPAYPALALAFYGALGAVNADTWATELGVLARATPRLITTGRPVPVGTSGGVTAAGFGAALGGAAFIGLVGFGLVQVAALATIGQPLWSDWPIVPIAAVAGVAGATFDSWLGARAQAIYYCDNCRSETERVVHRCGQQTRLIRGHRWLDNDWVNFLASVIGAGLAGALGAIFF